MKDYKHKHMPNHPNARYNGCIREHILIAESILGRFLEKGETVHHKDMNRYNNKPENIMVFKTNSDHIKYHKGSSTHQLSDGTYVCEESHIFYCKMCSEKNVVKKSARQNEVKEIREQIEDNASLPHLVRGIG